MSLPPTPDPDIQLTPLAGNETIALGGGVLGTPTMYTTTGAIAALGGGGGGGATGATGVLQASNGAGGFQVSDFVDNLTTPGNVTVALVDTITTGFGESLPGVYVSGGLDIGGGNTVGLLAAGPISKGLGVVQLTSFGTQPSAFITTRANGILTAPTKVTSGDLGAFLTYGYDGSAYQNGGSLSFTAESDFSGTPTSKIDLGNASSLGLHIAADGTFSIDGVVTSPALTVAAAATVTTGVGAGTITNAPVAGNPAVFIEIRVNGTTYAVPGWALA